MTCIRRLLSGFILATLATVDSVEAQINVSQLSGRRINTITTAVPFLMITPDSRAGGMGDAGVATSPDANANHWNASKLAFAERNIGVSINYTPWLRRLVPDINLAYLSGFYKLNKDQALSSTLRYFSMGNIQFTDINGNNIGQFNPNEWAWDVAYSRKLSENFSGGITLRYLFSNLTNQINVQGANTRPGQTVAADISAFYQKKDLEVAGKKALIAAGANISNIGGKVRYSENNDRDFIPINMRLGAAFTYELDKFNSLTFAYDLNKLLVPTEPIYQRDNLGNPVVDPSTNKQVIQSGKDPDRSIVSGMFGSFSDAPDGFGEEMRELTHSIGIEYWYDKLVAFRAGYFYEAPSKGFRQFVSLGAGLRYNVFGIDFAYLIPTVQQHPLQNTLRFSLIFDFDSFSKMNATPDDGGN